MPTKTYQLTPAKFALARQALINAGVPLEEGNAGLFHPAKHPEIELGYVYDGKATLTMTIQDSAWYETADEIWSGLAPYLA